jgi:hypothetical protein
MRNSTIFEFNLPKGFLDAEGCVYQTGMMRLATGEDEVYVQKHPQVRQNPAYAMLVMLSRLIDDFGPLSVMTPDMLEQLFLIDLLYLRDFFAQIHQPLDVVSGGKVFGYPLEQLYQEVALIAFYFHWSLDDILSLEHSERSRWVQLISQLRK